MTQEEAELLRALRWKRERLHDAQEHSFIVKLVSDIVERLRGGRWLGGERTALEAAAEKP